MNNLNQQRRRSGFSKMAVMVLAVLFFPTTIFSQSLPQNSNKTVIINDSNDITVKGLNSKNIRFFFSRSLHVKINDSAGLAMFSKILLPESFDSQTQVHQPKYRNYQHAYIFMEVNDFQVKIVDKSGERKEPQLQRKELQVNMTPPGLNFYENYSQFLFQIGNLSIGDEVFIDYAYSVSYLYQILATKEFFITSDMLELSSMRVFFHGRFDKKKYSFSLSTPEKMVVDVAWYNGGKPDSLILNENTERRIWVKTNLKGCLAEVGARPYKTLPHFVFTIRPEDWYYTIPNTFKEVPTPFYAIFAKQREVEILRATRNVDIGTRNKDYIDLSKIYTDMISDIIDDSTGYVRVKTVINKLAQDYSFVTDTNYFRTKNMAMDELGNYLQRGMIRDISRYETYTAFLAATRTNYFTAYLADKRYGVIDNHYFKPMIQDDMLLVSLLSDSSLHWIIPKKSKFTLLLNELPFYYENTTSRLVHFSDWAGKDQPINEQFRGIETPESQLKHNYRRCSVFGKINLDSKVSQFETKIDLSGQFSTLTRGVYKFDEFDPSINPLYGEKLWEIGRDVHGLKFTTNLMDDEFPFNAIVTAQYSFSDLVTTEGNTASIPLKNWFKHVIDADLETENRCLDFYPDFVGKDNFNYLLQFNQPVILIDSVDIQLINEFADYRFQIVQRDSQTILISSSLFQNNEVISSDKVSDVWEIFQAIIQSNAYVLRVKINP